MPSRGQKALAGAKAHPSNLDFGDLLALARAAGFELKRTRGSHQIMAREGTEEILNLQPRDDGKAKKYQVDQLLELIEKYQIEIS